LNTWDIPFRAKVVLKAWYPGGAVAVGGAACGFLQFCVHPRCTGQQPQAIEWLTEDVQFYTFALLLAVDIERPKRRAWVERGGIVWLFDAIDAKRGTVAFPIQLDPGFGLLAALGR